MTTYNLLADTAISTPVVLDLEENNIDGEYLSEPLDKHTMEQLRWWLLCHDMHIV